jgi:bisphosphoglycerate-dependent phosphoglycerate mutase
MSTLVLLRRGESEGNARGAFAGWIDAPSPTTAGLRSHDENSTPPWQMAARP